jgi:hypothetical protein
VLHFQPTAFGPHIHHRQVGVVVDEKRLVGQTADRL